MKPERTTTRTTEEIIQDVELKFRKYIITPNPDCSYDDDCKCPIHYESNIQKKLDDILHRLGGAS